MSACCVSMKACPKRCRATICKSAALGRSASTPAGCLNCQEGLSGHLESCQEALPSCRERLSGRLRARRAAQGLAKLAVRTVDPPEGLPKGHAEPSRSAVGAPRGLVCEAVVRPDRLPACQAACREGPPRRQEASPKLLSGQMGCQPVRQPVRKGRRTPVERPEVQFRRQGRGNEACQQSANHRNPDAN